MNLSDGTVLGRFSPQSYSSIDRHIAHTFAGGIRIPKGQTLSLTATTTVAYSTSGYDAQTQRHPHPATYTPASLDL